MAGRPGTLPWNMATFTGANPVTTLSDNFNFLNNQINDSGAGFTTFAVDTGSTNNLVITLASAPVAYEAGMMVCVQPVNTNTGPSVINVNALGNQSIVTPASVALNGGELSKGFTVVLVYDGTNFRIVGNCALGLSLGGQTGNVFVNCGGYTSVNLRINWTSGSALITTLQLVGQGVPISLLFNNGIGSSNTFFINATNAANASVTSITAFSAGTVNGVTPIDMRASGVTIGSGNSIMFTGSLESTTSMFLSK